MARHLFGGGISDFVVSYGDGGALLLAAGVEVTFWSARTGGSQYTDLLDLTDTPTTSVTSDSTGAIPQLRGPDGVRSMWAVASADGTGGRHLMLATDLPADIAALEGRVAILEATVATQQTMLANALYGVKYDAGAGAYPAIPTTLSGQQYLIFLGPSVPTTARAKDLHIKTVE